MSLLEIIIPLKEILIQNNWTIATAESLTAGLVSSSLASISGSSKYLLGGVSAYSIPVKAKILGVDLVMAEKVNAYSPEVAKQMAQGICALFGSNLGIATTGYAEPDPEYKIYEPQAFVAISFLGELSSIQIKAGDVLRNEARAYITKEALRFLLHILDERISQ